MGVGEDVIKCLVGLPVNGVTDEGSGVFLGFTGVGEIVIVRLVGLSVIAVTDEGSGVFSGFSGVGENVIVRLVGLIVDTILGDVLGDSLCAFEGFGVLSGSEVGPTIGAIEGILVDVDGSSVCSEDGTEEGCKDLSTAFTGRKL